MKRRRSRSRTWSNTKSRIRNSSTIGSKSIMVSKIGIRRGSKEGAGVTGVGG
jgi:hypothetical protein